ncbi:S10 family peptidase [Arundinibacter roseus]|uniref:Carboxypeptidase n=1 Tax=Arundinibacter roseus TaxID=2070510 RepID=A0A4R4KG74_9BACT|nr:carboxypeptidase [Arundinibacter roseus]TDB65892.1 carboxypeptidase [Arundinibacter roseus]
MNKKLCLSFIWLLIWVGAHAQNRLPQVDTDVVTKDQVTIKGKRIPYSATAGTQPVWNEAGQAIASLFYVYYERTDVTDRASRPLVISFNGGPGAASCWMHIGYTGPKRLLIDDEGYPVQPYGIQENPHSILDVADIVYVEPVNTGFSRMLSDTISKATFFGVNADIKYLAEWLNTFVSRKNRWPSPKYLVGESYGTNRVSGLSLELQNSHWMYLNGVVLVSPTGLGIERGVPVEAANFLPYYAATAWYHKALPADLQQKDLVDILPEIEKFTINELIPAITKGGYLDPAARKQMAARMARYSGLSEKVILEHNLMVPPAFFWKELLRDKGFTVGRLDSRYLGIDRAGAGMGPDYSPEYTSWQHSFTPAINYYLREVLNYKTDLDYFIAGQTRPWSREGANTDRTGENLRQAMAQNPYLHVLIQSGYYDGACDYFNAKYDMWHIDPSGKMKDRFEWKGYRSGHMMYLRQEDVITSNEDIRAFILKTLPKPDQPARY